MEKKSLTEEELKPLKKQYYDLTLDLKDYRKGMMSRKFAEMTANQQERAKQQYKFLRFALSDNFRVVYDHGAADSDMLSHAIWNGMLPLKMRWTALKELWRRRTGGEI